MILDDLAPGTGVYETFINDLAHAIYKKQTLALCFSHCHDCHAMQLPGVSGTSDWKGGSVT